VRIEVGIRKTERAQWRSRTMSFRAEDDPQERWKAAGLTVATLVGEVASPPSDVALQPAGPAAPPAPASSALPPDTDRSRPQGGTARVAPGVVLEGAVRLGPGLESGSLRLGALAAIGYQPPRFPLQPWISGGYSTQAGGSSAVAVSWSTLGAGAAADIPVANDVAVRARTGFLLQRVAVAATDDVAGATQSGAAWKTGWLVGADALWPADSAPSVTAGMDAWTTSGRVTVRVRERAIGAEPIFGVAGRVGVRLRLP